MCVRQRIEKIASASAMDIPNGSRRLRVPLFGVLVVRGSRCLVKAVGADGVIEPILCKGLTGSAGDLLRTIGVIETVDRE